MSFVLVTASVMHVKVIQVMLPQISSAELATLSVSIQLLKDVSDIMLYAVLSPK
jgi:hypothetical protein